MKLHPVCRASEIPPGERKIVEIEGKSIGVFNLFGTYYALRNVCPHQFAPLCLGKITGYCEKSPVGEFHWSREGEIIRCPWHGWEFDIMTGRSIFNPHKVRTKSYPVSLEKGASSKSANQRSVGVPPASFDESGQDAHAPVGGAPPAGGGKRVERPRSLEEAPVENEDSVESFPVSVDDDVIFVQM